MSAYLALPREMRFLVLHALATNRWARASLRRACTQLRAESDSLPDPDPIPGAWVKVLRAQYLQLADPANWCPYYAELALVADAGYTASAPANWMLDVGWRWIEERVHYARLKREQILREMLPLIKEVVDEARWPWAWPAPSHTPLWSEWSDLHEMPLAPVKHLFWFWDDISDVIEIRSPALYHGPGSHTTDMWWSSAHRPRHRSRWASPQADHSLQGNAIGFHSRPSVELHAAFDRIVKERREIGTLTRSTFRTEYDGAGYWSPVESDDEDDASLKTLAGAEDCSLSPLLL